MALRKISLNRLRQLCDHLRRSHTAPYRTLSFSVQDIIASEADIGEIFGPEVAAQLQWRVDSAEILRWHKAPQLERVPDCAAFLRSLGFDPLFADLGEFRGGEQLYNGNERQEWSEPFDVVFDNVLQHVANAGQHLDNIVRAVRPGGYVFHLLPLCMINQGYWNPCPNLLDEFYRSNGFLVLNRAAFHGTRDNAVEYFVPSDVPAPVANDSAQIVIATRIRDVAPTRWPVQRKFVQSPDSKR